MGILRNDLALKVSKDQLTQKSKPLYHSKHREFMTDLSREPAVLIGTPDNDF